MTTAGSPRVSVLMPFYNAARFLAPALESILRQTFNDFELLLIDDGSTDESNSIIAKYSDRRIRLITNRVNRGLVAVLNDGLLLARGEYVARMDADDISLPERLATQVRFLDDHPEVGVCGTWVRFFPSEYDYLWKLPKDNVGIRCRLFRMVGVAHPSVMFRRRLFLENDLFYDPRFAYAEDYDLWVRALRFTDFANIPQVLLRYRISGDQVCSRHRDEQQAAVAAIRQRQLRHLGIDETPDQLCLHEQVMNDLVPLERDALERAEQWLLHLCEVNRTSGVYLSSGFEEEMLEVWFMACLRMAKAGICGWRDYAGSGLWKKTRLTLTRRIKYRLAWIARLHESSSADKETGSLA